MDCVRLVPMSQSWDYGFDADRAGCRWKTRWRPPEGPRSWRQKFPHVHGFQIHGGVVKLIGDLTLRIMIVGERILPFRSQEHTSELQSLTNLVCRLLLEKKKKT